MPRHELEGHQHSRLKELLAAILPQNRFYAEKFARVDGLPDYYALAVGSLSGGHGAMLAYIAGLAGASGMLIVATLALSSMTASPFGKNTPYRSASVTSLRICQLRNRSGSQPR